MEDFIWEYNCIGLYGRGMSVGVLELGNCCGGFWGGEEDVEEFIIWGNCGIRLIGDFWGIGCGYWVRRREKRRRKLIRREESGEDFVVMLFFLKFWGKVVFVCVLWRNYYFCLWLILLLLYERYICVYCRWGYDGVLYWLVVWKLCLRLFFVVVVGLYFDCYWIGLGKLGWRRRMMLRSGLFL